MPVILFFTVIGFLSGLAYVVLKRRIRIWPLLAATFLGLLALGAWKILKEQLRQKRRYY